MGDFYISPAEQRYEAAVQLAFRLGREYERAATTELRRLGETWHPDLSWEGQVAKRAAAYGPGRPLRFDDPDWPPVAVPGRDGVRCKESTLPDGTRRVEEIERGRPW